MVTVFALAFTFRFVSALTTGTTLATCTPEPLLMPLDVTVADKLTAAGRREVSETVSDVALAVVTVPTAPLSKVTVLLAAIASKPKPAMTILLAVAARSAVLSVTAGLTKRPELLRRSRANWL